MAGKQFLVNIRPPYHYTIENQQKDCKNSVTFCPPPPQDQRERWQKQKNPGIPHLYVQITVAPESNPAQYYIDRRQIPPPIISQYSQIKDRQSYENQRLEYVHNRPSLSTEGIIA